MIESSFPKTPGGIFRLSIKLSYSSYSRYPLSVLEQHFFFLESILFLFNFFLFYPNSSHYFSVLLVFPSSVSILFLFQSSFPQREINSSLWLEDPRVLSVHSVSLPPSLLFILFLVHYLFSSHYSKLFPAIQREKKQY